MRYTVEKLGGDYYTHYSRYSTWREVCRALSVSDSLIWCGSRFRILDNRTGLVVMRADVVEWINIGYPYRRVGRMPKKSLPWTDPTTYRASK